MSKLEKWNFCHNEDKIISFDTEKYNSLTNENKRDFLEFTITMLSDTLNDIKENIEMEKFKSTFNFKEELELVEKEINEYLSGNKFKSFDALTNFITMYYHIKRNYEIPKSIVYYIANSIISTALDCYSETSK